MNRELAEKVANTVLYEGYMLYPYRPSAMKNQQRWAFGTLYPPLYEEVALGTESAGMHTECLFTAASGATIHVHLRFLHLESHQLLNVHGEPVPSLVIDRRMLQGRDEGISRSVEFDLPEISGPPSQFLFHFPGHAESSDVRNAQGYLVGTVTRTQHELKGAITCSVETIGSNVYKLSIDVVNESALAAAAANRNKALLQSLLSAHAILSSHNAEFVSLLDPPNALRAAVARCKNIGNFPVLVGNAGEFDMLLCSPILLYDYPQIAPESAGDFFDGTEMDEMLTLRVMTLTNEEKDEMRSGDDRVRVLLQRTEETAREQLMRTHGTIRSLRPAGDKP